MRVVDRGKERHVTYGVDRGKPMLFLRRHEYLATPEILSDEPLCLDVRISHRRYDELFDNGALFLA